MKVHPLPLHATILLTLGLAAQAHGATVTLGAAQSFAVLGASTVTNTGPSVVKGDVGVSPGTAITGFPPGTVTGSLRSNDPVASQARADAMIAYGFLTALPLTRTLSGTNLGGLTLFPGVYFFSSTAELTGTLTLDANGQMNPSFVFQIGTAFNAADANSSIIAIGGADPSQVYFAVGSSATIGTGGALIGTIIADQSITLKTGASLMGRALALNGAVTLDSNAVTVPEPSSSILLLSGLGSLLMFRNRSRSQR